MKLFDLDRDADGRPIALRVRVPEIDLRTPLRAAYDGIRRRLPSASILPRIELRRDEDDRPAAIGIRVPTPSLDTAALRVRFAAAARRVRDRLPGPPARAVWAYRTLLFVALYVIPEIDLRRDEAGQLEAIALRFGGRAAAPERPHRVRTVTVPLSKWLNEPKRPGIVATFIEVWHYRRFINFLGAKSFRKLYARTMLGWVWVVVTPLFPILLNVFVFGALIGVNSEGIPYFLFLMIGNLAWDYFASALMWSTRGLEMHRKVIDRVYVPRVILPIATMTPAVFNFLINFAATLLVIGYYWTRDRAPYLAFGAHTLWSVAALVMITTLVLGISMFTAVWGETARDARFVIGNVTTILFLLTPVLYPSSQVPLKYQKWLILNPLASFVDAFKYGFFKTNPPDPMRFAVASVTSIVLLSGGLLFFNWRSEVEETVLA